jgi:glutamyl-tRNA(Gln) amidotransferase subunit E
MDYKKLGLRIGLEIHQQLDSKTKLFCRCPITKAASTEAEFPLSVERKLRAVPSELGDFDPAALHEYLRNRKFIYRFNKDSSCLVELDEDPPKSMNENALITALQVCKLLNCNVLDELYVMRKTVIDGSSVSGFQRTVLVGTDGCLETSFGKVGIQTICLEEDSAPALRRENDIVEYRLDRSGIPLVEIATMPDMHTPEQAREVAELIGTLLRSVAVVRGIGSIRQDVNISIEEGARIEIKGFQEIEKIEKLIENEVQRQLALLEIKDELKKRGIDKESEIKSESKDVTSIFHNTSCNFIRKMVDDDGRVFALKLNRFSGLFKKQCGDRTFGKELSAYAESFGFGGIIHSDEDLEKYKLINEFEKLRKEMNADERGLILVIAGKKNLDKAMAAILERAQQCLHGVPEETRVADGIGSKFTRPLPGSGRMYPETDIKPVRITKEFVELVEVPETLDEKRKGFEKELPKEMASQIVRSRYLKLYEELKIYDPIMVATTLLSTFTDLKRQGYNVDSINKMELEELFIAARDMQIPKTKIPEILTELSQGKAFQEIKGKYISISDDELRKIIRETIMKNMGKSESALMGLVMKEISGRADGKKVMQILREENR